MLAISVAIVFLTALFNFLNEFKLQMLEIFVTISVIIIAYKIYVNLYFNSNKFREIKLSIKQYKDNCNELNNHIENLKSSYFEADPLNYGQSQLVDTSTYNMKRREWAKEVKTRRTYNCSASVVKNANNQPFKYLCKYFNIKTDEKTLSQFESVLNNFAAAEQGKSLLVNERDTIVSNAAKSIPSLIMFFNKKRVIRELGFEDIDLSDIYFPVYAFHYVSPGGNSSSRCEIKLNVENLDNFIAYLGELVKFRKSVAGQRALMTSSLRERIKTRDNYTCQHCNISIYDEKNLLLEIDHVFPLSKGGLTSEENLQTLCWKCNRTKGSKTIAA